MQQPLSLPKVADTAASRGAAEESLCCERALSLACSPLSHSQCPSAALWHCGQQLLQPPSPVHNLWGSVDTVRLWLCPYQLIMQSHGGSWGHRLPCTSPSQVPVVRMGTDCPGGAGGAPAAKGFSSSSTAVRLPGRPGPSRLGSARLGAEMPLMLARAEPRGHGRVLSLPKARSP